jgi:uncharacterized protein (DUF169 family)
LNHARDFAQALEKSLRLETYPVAIKLLRAAEGAPEKAQRPRKDLQTRITPCQGWGLARKEGMTIAMLREDLDPSCGLAMIAFGLVEPPRWWLEGNLAYGTLTSSKKAGITAEEHVFRLRPGEFNGLIVSPLRTATFDPDIVLAYCSSVQAMRLVKAASYENGHPLSSQISARSLCSDVVVQTFLTEKCQVGIPCQGDRLRAFTRDDEIAFGIPNAQLRDIVRGLNHQRRVSHPSSPILRIYLGKKTLASKKFEKLRKRIENQLQ